MGGSAYRMISAEIADRITRGDLRPGDRVPSTRAITARWGVAMATATRVLADLQAQGLVRAVPGVGTVVAEQPGSRVGTVVAEQPGLRLGKVVAEQPGSRIGTVVREHADSGRDLAAAPRPGLPSRPTAGSRSAATPPSASGVTNVPAVSRRGRDQQDMRDRIVRTAIELADADGIGAVTMRRIALALDVPTMSLYRWVPAKDDLLTAMLDELMGNDPWPEKPTSWRPALEYLARRQWAQYQRHPWMAHIISLYRPQLAPRAMMHTEWALAALAAYPINDTTKLLMTLTLFGHVKAAAAGVETENQAVRDTGFDFDEWMRQTDAQFAPTIRSGRYPHLADLDGSAEVDFDLDALFEFGLAALLDGFERVLTAATRR